MKRYTIGLIILFLISGCANNIPDLIMDREPLPKIGSSKSREKLLSYNNFLLLPPTKGEELNESLNITTGVRYDIYQYEFSKIGQLNNAIVKVLNDVKTDINIIDKDALPIILEEQSLNMSGLTDSNFDQFNELKSVDAIIFLQVDYLRNKLIYSLDTGGYNAFYIPELSISMKVVSLSTRETLSNRSIRLNSQMFFKEDKRIHKFGNLFYLTSIEELIGIAPYYLLQDFMDNESAWIYSSQIKFIRTTDLRLLLSDYKKYLLINPKSPKTLSSIGWAYAELGDKKEFERYSIDAYDLITDKKDTPPWIMLNYGSAMLSKGEINEAERIYREAIKLSGDLNIIEGLNKDLKVLEKISPELQKSVAEIQKRLF